MDATKTQFWTANDVADWLHQTKSYVLRLARQNEIPHIVMPDGEILFDRAELAQWIKAYRRAPEKAVQQ